MGDRGGGGGRGRGTYQRARIQTQGIWGFGLAAWPEGLLGGGASMLQLTLFGNPEVSQCGLDD